MNHATVHQHLAEKSEVAINQDGKFNDASATQTGRRQHSEINQDGNLNTASTDQSGSWNDADIYIYQKGSFQTASINQYGTGGYFSKNKADIIQLGLNNDAAITQKGLSHDADISQSGLNSDATVTQKGYNHDANINKVGFGIFPWQKNTAYISQGAGGTNSMTATISQYGHSNSAGIVQP